MKRDVKALYRRYNSGDSVLLAGLNVAFDVPKAPDIICKTAEQFLEENISQILAKIKETS